MSRHTLIPAVVVMQFLTLSNVRAAIVMDAVEVNGDVLIMGGGSVDTVDGLVAQGTQQIDNGVNPSFAFVGFGGTIQGYEGLVGPSNFGSGLNRDATFSSAPNGPFTIGAAGVGLGVPTNYLLGEPLSGTLTFENATITSLGMDPGTYVWTWGSGASVDSFTLNVVPEPHAAFTWWVGLLIATLSWRRSP
ncbi:MAG: hypothetical protein AAGF97_02420 [Planctomycetota bacterium]